MAASPRPWSAAQGALRPGLTASRVSDIAAAVVCDEVCDVLVDQRAWTFDDYELWLATALDDLLLSARKPSPRRREPT